MKITGKQIEVWVNTLAEENRARDIETGIDTKAYKTIGALEQVIFSLMNDRRGFWKRHFAAEIKSKGTK